VITNVSSNGGNDGVIDITPCGGVPPFTYLWSNGANTQDLVHTQAGTYTVTVVDSYGCTKQSSFTVTQSSGQGIPVNGNVTQVACGTTCTGAISITSQSGYPVGWSGPNGYTNGDVWTITGLCTGVYTVTLTGGNNFTATASFAVTNPSNSIDLSMQSSNPGYCNGPNAGTPGNCEKTCPNTTITYSVDPPQIQCGGTPQYTWTVVGATSFHVSPNGQSCTVVWGGPGAGSVSVQGSNSVYCFQTATRCVTIVQQPVAKISSSPAADTSHVLHICKGQTVLFHNLSLNADLSDWVFGDDFSKSTEQDPQHTFSAAGTYKVTLIARSLCLCSDTAIVTVVVMDGDSPLVNCTSTICQGEQVTYHTAGNCATFNWAVSPNGTILAGGGMQDDSITVQWNTGPSGTINLNVQNCTGNVCPQPTQIQIPILSDLAEVTGKTRVCPGSEEVYKITPFGSGTYFTWKASSNGSVTEGQGTNKVTVAWSATLSAQSWLTVDYYNCYLGCTGRDTIWIKVLPPMGISGPVEICQGLTGTFQAKQVITNGAGVLCNWTVYDPSGAANQMPATLSLTPPSFALAGNYRLTAMPTGAGLDNTCSDSAGWKIVIEPKPPKPASIVGQTEFCPNLAQTYVATGFSPANNLKWQVKTSAAAPQVLNGNPIVTNFTSGTPRWVAVAQVTADELGCVSDTTRLDVQELSTFSFTGPIIACEETEAVYTAPKFESADYFWEVLPAGSGVIKKGQGTNILEVFWVKPGNNTVNVKVCSHAASLAVEVWASPVPSVVSPAGVCAGSKGLVATSTPYVSYIWKDVDGATVASTPQPQVGPGLYAVVVTDQKGCIGTATFGIIEYPKPNVSLTTPDLTVFCLTPIVVHMTALVDKDSNYTFDWSYNNAPLGIHTPTYSSSLVGAYTVKVSNQYGCTASSAPINIFQSCGGGGGGPVIPPICPFATAHINYDPTPRCDSFQFHLIAGPTYVPGTAQWQFGASGSTYLGSSVVDNPVFKFPNGGKYLAVVTVELTNGSFCRALDSVRVEAFSDFGVKTHCPGDSTFFKDEGTFLPDGAGITGWQWNFGDPGSGVANTSTIRDISHTYALPGAYTVQLTVTAAAGCTATASQQVVIPGPPAINFAPLTKDCAGNATPLSITATPEITFTDWTFGDPSSGALNALSGTTVYHKYSAAGIYQAMVTVKNVAGCVNTDLKAITITPNNLSGTIQPGQSVICEGKILVLQAPPGGVSYAWSDHSTGSVLTVNKQGNYFVTVTSAEGCTYVPPAKIITVNPAPDGVIKAVLHNDDGQVVGLAFPSLEVCQGQDVDLTIATNGAYTFTWSNGSIENELIFSKDRQNLLTTGNHTYTVTMTNPATGCTAVAPGFTVMVDPLPSGFSATVNHTCAGTPSTVQYVGPQPPGWQFLWNNGQAGTSFATADPGHYFVRVVNEFGCVAQSNTVTIKPGPNIAAVPNGCHKRCNPDTLCIPPMPEIVSWQWYLNGNIIPGATTPNYIATASGTYYVAMVDTGGCTAQSGLLELDLYQGYGNVYGNVWSDVNNNGMVDAGDTLLQNIPVHLLKNFSLTGTTQTGSSGKFVFNHVLSTGYDVTIDTANLSPAWTIVIGKKQASLMGCNASASVDLLLRHFMCPPLQTAVDLYTCPGGTATYQGVSIPEGQSKAFTFKTITDCDSTVTVTVHALPTPSSALSVQVCPGSTYQYQSVQIPAGQTQSFTLQNATGCDSTVTVTVHALPVSSSAFSTSVCPGSTYPYQGVQIPAGQTQSFILQNATGCDSTVTVTVNTLPVSSSAFSTSVCPGTSYTYQGVQVPAGQTQSFTLQNATGCDSVVTVSVVALPVYSTVADVDVCTGSSYGYHGVQIPAGQSHTFTLQSVSGCDSVVTVQVHGMPSLSSAVQVSVCPGTAYMYQGVQVPIGQSHAFTLQAISGCDSVVTVTVQGLPVLTGVHDVQVCAGSAYTYQGVQIPAGQSQAFTLQTATGCDSVVTVTVHPLPVLTGALQASVCAGTAYTYQGVQIPAGQSQTFMLQTPSGCDSVVTVSVQALPALSSALQVKVCAGTAYTYHGTSIPAGQTQSFTLQSVAGCDSVVTVAVQGLPALSSALQVKVCAGTTYAYQGAQIPAGQTQSFTLQNAAGCDSVVTVSVQALPLGSSMLHTAACPGTTYDYYGTPVPAGQSKQFTLQTVSGCDSVVTVVVDQYAIDSTASEAYICPGTTYAYNGQDLTAGTHVFHYKGQEGCDSMVTVQIVAYPDLAFAVKSDKSCLNTPNGSLAIDHLTGGTPPFGYSNDGLSYQATASFPGLSAGNYTLYVKDSHDCLFKEPAVVEAYPPLEVKLQPAVLACDSPSVRLIPELNSNAANLTYKWWNGAQSPEVDATDAGKVWVEVTDLCETVHQDATVEWAGLPSGYSYVYVPNTFAPASDHYENAGFRPYFADNILVKHYMFEVYDRWGTMIFRTERPEVAWEGMKGSKQIMDTGVFVWRLEASFEFCGRPIALKLRGDVTMVR
jgi:PKD repeat protein